MNTPKTVSVDKRMETKRHNSKKNTKPHTLRKTGQAEIDKQRRQEKADDRLNKWQELSPVAQLKELDRRLGKNTGAKKQRARLFSLITTKA